MYSGEGEEVKLFMPVNPAGNVEEWLRHVEKSMKATLRDNIDRSLQVYPEVLHFFFSPLFSNRNEALSLLTFPCLLTHQQPRTEWVLSWPGQVVIAGCQVFWTTEVSEALEQEDLSSNLYPQLQTQVSARDLILMSIIQIVPWQWSFCFLTISIREIVKEEISCLLSAFTSSGASGQVKIFFLYF